MDPSLLSGSGNAGDHTDSGSGQGPLQRDVPSAKVEQVGEEINFVVKIFLL